MELEKNLPKALEELRKTKKRKFTQSVELIVNLKKIDIKKNPVNAIINVPHKIKDKKIAGFFESKQKEIDTITENEFKEYSDKKKLKKLIKEYDFFIAEAKLMPKVATIFGRVLGPAGKMPSPQLGILPNVNEKSLGDLKEKINNSIKIKTKEPSIKIVAGKESLKDSELIENITQICNSLIKNLPQGKENIKNIKIKFTMSKPQRIE